MKTHSPPISGKSDFSVVCNTLRDFSDCTMARNAASDGCLTVRVVGEFSAGKTRLLSELLSDQVPLMLLPISSPERQTKLQLEITYGSSVKLTVVERAVDHALNPEPINELASFPKREELKSYDPVKHRLRLTIPEPRLILPTGDGYSDDKSPKKLFLIDTPGWNSGDDDIAEGPAKAMMTGVWNLSLVFVTSASRLDGIQNSERLREFMVAFADADFVGQPSIVFIVTHCPKLEQDRLGERARDQINKIWREVRYSEEYELLLKIICVDFSEVTKDELIQFRDDFWSSVLKPLATQNTATNSLVENIKKWPDEWDIRPKAVGINSAILRATKLLNLAKNEGKFLHGMNRTRLIGLSEADAREKIVAAWLRQLECDHIDQLFFSSNEFQLEINHPLYSWWNKSWFIDFERVVESLNDFFVKARGAIYSMPTNHENFNSYLSGKLSSEYKKSTQEVNSRACKMMGVVATCTKDSTVEVFLATAIRLSLLQSRFSDYCQLFKSLK